MRKFKRKLTSGTVTSGMDGVRESKSGSKVLLQSQFELSWSQTVFLAQSLHHFLPARRALPGPFLLATFGIMALPTALDPAISSCPCHAPTSLLYNELTVSCDLGVRFKDQHIGLADMYWQAQQLAFHTPHVYISIYISICIYFYKFLHACIHTDINMYVYKRKNSRETKAMRIL